MKTFWMIFSLIVLFIVALYIYMTVQQTYPYRDIGNFGRR